jgi:hypothetical protein
MSSAGLKTIAISSAIALVVGASLAYIAIGVTHAPNVPGSTSTLILLSTQTVTSLPNTVVTRFIAVTTTVLNNVTETITLTPPEPPNPSIIVVSLRLVLPSTPAGPALNLTIINAGIQEVSNVTVVFENHTFSFAKISRSSPLASDSVTSMLIGGVGINASGTSPYPILVYGTYSDGSPFGFYEDVTIS